MGLGWEGCQELVTAGAAFSAQSEPIAGITSLEGYTEWMKAMGGETLKGRPTNLQIQITFMR
jgi:hypothetical protein